MQERYGGNNPKNVWWNNVVKAGVERKEAASKKVFGARYEVAKNRFMEVYKEEREGVKGIFIRRKRR